MPMPEAFIPSIVDSLTQGGVRLGDIHIEHLDVHRSDDQQYWTNLLIT